STFASYDGKSSVAHVWWTEPVTSASGEQEITASAVAIKTAKRPMEPSRRPNAGQTALALRFSLVVVTSWRRIEIPPRDNARWCEPHPEFWRCSTIHAA